MADGSLFAFEDVLGQEISFDFESGMSNDVLVDIAFTGFSGHGLLPGTVVSDELTIETTGGAFHFTLAATIPMPDLTGDYNRNGMVEQGDLDLVLLHWGDDASEVSDDWINDLPSGAVDQQELDAVLLGWGTSVDAVGGVVNPNLLRVFSWPSLWRASSCGNGAAVARGNTSPNYSELKRRTGFRMASRIA